MRIRYLKPLFWQRIDKLAEENIVEAIFLMRKVIRIAPGPVLNTMEFAKWIRKYQEPIRNVTLAPSFEELKKEYEGD